MSHRSGQEVVQDGDQVRWQLYQLGCLPSQVCRPLLHGAHTRCQGHTGRDPVHQGQQALLPQLYRLFLPLPVQGQPADKTDHRQSAARLQHMLCLCNLPDLRKEDQEIHRCHVTEEMHRSHHMWTGGEDARENQKDFRRQVIQ